MSEHNFTARAFYDRLEGGKLTGSRCTHCERVFFPPRPYCPVCHSADVEPVDFSGRGKLAAFTVISIAPSAMIAAGYDRKNPYCAGIVELEEGPRISAQILGVDVAHPETIQVGTSLTATTIERGDGENRKTYLAFQA